MGDSSANQLDRPGSDGGDAGSWQLADLGSTLEHVATYFTSIALLVLDLIGVFAFALSGNMLAARRGYDITGGLVLGYLAGLGGGIVRDLILDLPPLAFAKPIYLIPPLLSALLVYLFGSHVERRRQAVLTLDAVGLAIFCMTGATVALNNDANVPTAVVMGILTAAGGGMLRDVVANENPAVFNRNELYIVPAFVGATMTVTCKTVGPWNEWIAVLIAVGVFAFRMLALQRGWQVPGQVRESRGQNQSRD